MSPSAWARAFARAHVRSSMSRRMYSAMMSARLLPAGLAGLAQRVDVANGLSLGELGRDRLTSSTFAHLAHEGRVLPTDRGHYLGRQDEAQGAVRGHALHERGGLLADPKRVDEPGLRV